MSGTTTDIFLYGRSTCQSIFSYRKTPTVAETCQTKIGGLLSEALKEVGDYIQIHTEISRKTLKLRFKQNNHYQTAARKKAHTKIKTYKSPSLVLTSYATFILFSFPLFSNQLFTFCISGNFLKICHQKR